MWIPSWRAAGLVIQAFFIGEIVPMTIIVGSLYQSSPLRLCNAYGLEDQQRLGSAVIWVATAAALVWLVRAAWAGCRSLRSAT